MEKLKQLATQRLGRTLESPADFEYFSEQIQKSTGEYLSPTTLKRVFGHIPYSGQTRPSTLSIIARYVGFNGWQAYQDAQQIESGFISTKSVSCSDLNKGQKILLTWNPDRECIVEYLGANRFVVIHAQNCKLQVGDRFTSFQMTIDQPLTASNVECLRYANTQDTYIAGSLTGLTHIELLNV